MEEFFKEAKGFKCNKCIYLDDVYEFIEINEVYFLLKDFKQIGIKLDQIEGRNAIMRYWFKYKDDFIRDKDKKEKGYLDKRKNKIIEDLFYRAVQFEEFQKSKEWKHLIPSSFTYQVIASMDDGTIEKDIITQYENIIAEYPDFVEKAKQIKGINDKDEQFKEYQIYFKIGIYKFNKRNIDSLLTNLADCVKDEKLEQSTNDNNTDLLQIVKQKFETALLKNHKKEKSKKNLEEYRNYFLDMLSPNFITHCYYGNEIYEFTGDNEITVNEKKITLEKELAEWGARAYRMSIEANRVIDEGRLNKIFS